MKYATNDVRLRFSYKTTRNQSGVDRVERTSYGVCFGYTNNRTVKPRSLQHDPVAIFQQTAANFRQRRLWVLKSLIFPLNLPKWGILSPKFGILGRKFSDKKNIFFASGKNLRGGRAMTLLWPQWRPSVAFLSLPKAFMFHFLRTTRYVSRPIQSEWSELNWNVSSVALKANWLAIQLISVQFVRCVHALRLEGEVVVSVAGTSMT